MTNPDVERAELADLLGKEVILDTRGPLLYIGVLEAIGDCFYTLTNVDVHDMHMGGASKEVYAMETVKHGVRVNRERVFVRRAEIISISRLDEVIRY